MTIRTNAQLQALLADNTAGDISPQDIRDFLDSVMGVYGSIGIGDGVAGQTLATDTPEKMTEWTHNGVANGMTPAFAADEITILHDGVYHVTFNVSFQGTTGETFQFVLRKDNVEVVPHISMHRKTSSADVGSGGIADNLTLVAGDVLSIWVESDAAGTPVWVESQLSAHRIG
jgi:hypothetical protein